MQALLGDEFPVFLASYEQPPSVGLRVNTLKLSPEAFQQIAPFPLKPIPWVAAGFTLPPEARPGKHPYHTAGLYYLQDPAAMAVAELCAPRPGERVLDLAAAPGGKTTHLAALMQGRGLLVANDLHPRRVQTLAKNVERWGVSNVIVLNETPPRLAAHFGAFFDRVLVDAPCSGEGMFRKDPAARGEWSPKLVKSCAVRQDAILADAARLVRPGGWLVYATCTFAPEEDEGTLARFLAAHPDYDLIVAPDHPGFSPGRPEWIAAPEARLARPVRLWPHHAPGEGHFIALLRRAESTAPPAHTPASQPRSLPRPAAEDFAAFAAAALRWEPPRERLALFGSHLYLLLEDCPALQGLRVVHWGWWLGNARKNRFEPAHALAAGLKGEHARLTLPLTPEDPALKAYLRGEVVASPGEDGWVLVTVDGFPLGWGKRVQGRLKPRLPKWLRQFD